MVRGGGRRAGQGLDPGGLAGALAAGGGAAGADRDPAAHAVEPAAQRVVDADRRGLADEDEEGGLEGVGGGVGVVEGAAADAPDHRAVPLNQGGERRLGRAIAAGREPLQQLAVGETAGRPEAEERLDVAGHGGGFVPGHGTCSRGGVLPCTMHRGSDLSKNPARIREGSASPRRRCVPPRGGRVYDGPALPPSTRLPHPGGADGCPRPCSWPRLGDGRAGPLALHPENPRYFLFRGRPTVLITSGEHYGAVLNLDFDAGPYLEELRRRGLNLTRVFSGTYFERPGSFGIRENTLAPPPSRLCCPWARVGEKFDLGRWDEGYFGGG